MSDHVRRIMIQERLKAERGAKGGLPLGEKLGRWGLVVVAIIITCNSLVPSPVHTGPPPLNAEDREYAKLVATSSHMSIEAAEAFVLAHRPSEYERRRLETERRQREAEQDALRRAYMN